MLDRLWEKLAQKVAVRVGEILQANLPKIIETIVSTVINEVFKRYQILAPTNEIRNTVNDIMSRMGIRR